MVAPPNSGGRSGRSRRPSPQLQAGDAGDPKPDAPARGSGDEPDVLLDVPKLTVEEISLEVDNLHAQIALEARLADLVQLRVGADVEIERVALEIKGVEAQAQLKARLDNVLAIIERALDTVDNNPELLTELARSAQRAAGGLGEGVAKVGEEGGQLVEGTVEEPAARRGPVEEGGAARGGRGAGDRVVRRSPEAPVTRERGRIGFRLEAPKGQLVAAVNAGKRAAGRGDRRGGERDEHRRVAPRRGNRGLSQRGGASRTRAAAHRAQREGRGRRPRGRVQPARESAAPARARRDVPKTSGCTAGSPVGS